MVKYELSIGIAFPCKSSDELTSSEKKLLSFVNEAMYESFQTHSLDDDSGTTSIPYTGEISADKARLSMYGDTVVIPLHVSEIDYADPIRGFFQSAGQTRLEFKANSLHSLQSLKDIEFVATDVPKRLEKVVDLFCDDFEKNLRKDLVRANKIGNNL